jgi:hypothetical protein
MGRKKKLTEAELENTQTALTIENTHQSESEEAELLSELDTEASVVSEDSIEASDVSTVTEEVALAAPAKKARKPRTPKAKEVKEEPVEPSKPQQDPWAAIQILSDSVQKLVEHNQTQTHPKQIENGLLPPPRLDLDTHELLRPPSPQNPSLFITKFAVAASIVAVLISFVSLALSQSARQAAVGASQIAQQTSPSMNITRGTRRR